MEEQTLFDPSTIVTAPEMGSDDGQRAGTLKMTASFDLASKAHPENLNYLKD